MTTNPIRVLLVEDVEQDAELMLLELRRGGYEPSAERVETVAGFRSALAGGEWDVILCDNAMPGFDAVAALGLLGELGLDVPLIVVSGTIGEERAVELMRAGAADFVMKSRLMRLVPAAEREVRESTVRRHREKTIRLLEALVESSDDAISSKTLDGVLTSWNPAAERLYGWPAAEAVGRPVSFLIPPDKAAETTEVTDRLRAGERIQTYETVWLHRDGTRIDVSLTLSPIKDAAGRLVGASTSARDIREKKCAEEQLNRTTALLRAVADGTSDAVFVKDLAGRYLLFNKAAARFVGHSIEEVLGRDDTAIFGADDARRLMAHDREVMDFDRISTHEESLTAAGTTRTYLSTKAPYKDAGGKVIGLVGISRDISDRKQAETALRESEAFNRSLMDASPDCIKVLDLDGRLLHMNGPGLCVMEIDDFGPLCGQAWTGLWPEDAAPEIERAITAANTGAAYIFQSFCPTAKGRPRWWEVTVSPVRDTPDGQVVRLLVVSRDITERVRAEAELRASEERYRTLLERIPDPLFVFDRETLRYLAVNDAAVTCYGYTRAEFLGMTIKDIRPAEGVPALLEMLGRSLGGFEDRGRWRHRKKNGTVFDVEITAHDLSLDGKPACIVLARDITDRKRAEDAIRESRARNAAILEAALEGIITIDHEGRVLEFNPAAEAIFGYRSGGVVGREMADLIIPPPLRDAHRKGMAHYLATGEGPLLRQRLELTALRADGTEFPVELAITPLPGGGPPIFTGFVRDITDRKRSEVERTELLASINLQVERMPLAYLLSGPDMRYTRWNPAAERIFGFTQSEILGRHPFEVIVPQQAQPLVAEIFVRLAAGEMDAHGACENVTRDGQTITCEWYNTPLFDKDGTFQGVLSLAQDISARRLAENELHLRDRAIQAVTGGLLITDAKQPDNPIIYVSSGFEQLTGYTVAEVVGRNCRFLGGLDTDPEALARLREAVRDGLPCDVELLNYRKDGTLFWNALSISPVHDSHRQVTHFVGVQQDVTERKRAEATLRDREELLRNVIAHIPAGVFWKDRDGRFLGANHRFALDQGFSTPDVVVGKTDSDLPVARAEAEAFRAADLRVMVRGEPILNAAETQTRADGRMFHLLVSKVPLRDTTGQVSGVLGVYQDVTEYRRMEEQFRQAQKMEAVGRLAGGVAHDFNNLLTVINGYSEIVHYTLPSGDPNRELVGEITKAGERAAGLTRQLLAFSRQTILEPKVLDVNALVRNLENMLRRLLGEDIDLITLLAPDLGRVKADPGLLEQAVVNLCVNARDAMPRGGKITVETSETDLQPSYAEAHSDVPPGRYVQISVADTGEGMTPEVQARIFEPFFTTKEAGKGTGLGLSMVFGFVKQSGGHVRVHSEPGRGAEFKVYLPRFDDAPLSGKSGVYQRSMPLGTETILLVEDEDHVRALGQYVLRLCGYTVLDAANGTAAVKVAEGFQGTLHLLVTDVVMPGGMGGREVAETVVAQHTETKVLFTSGYTDDAVVRHGVLEKGTHFLQKPFSPAALAQKVRDVLDGKG